jgi:hypothetical protein
LVADEFQQPRLRGVRALLAIDGMGNALSAVARFRNSSDWKQTRLRKITLENCSRYDYVTLE